MEEYQDELNIHLEKLNNNENNLRTPIMQYINTAVKVIQYRRYSRYERERLVEVIKYLTDVLELMNKH